MACYSGTVTSAEYSSADRSSPITELYNPKAVITHAALLRQAFAHCGRFPTAASRRSLDRVSVPMWPADLSVRLRLLALGGLWPANWLMRRRPIPRRGLSAPFRPPGPSQAHISGISGDFSPVFRSEGQVTNVLLTRLPLDPCGPRSTCMY